MSKLSKTLLIATTVVLIDQIVKIWIKTHFYLGESVKVLEWFEILFVENNGMAFGMELGGVIGKIALSTFRIGAVTLLFYYISRLAKENAPTGYMVSVGLIMAGAIGNIIDSAFYGLIFDGSVGHHVASLFPEGGGYQDFLQGKVVDMLYFPMVDTVLPESSPIWAGESLVFFRPVFNIADSAISIGVAIIILFYKDFLRKQ